MAVGWRRFQFRRDGLDDKRMDFYRPGIHRRGGANVRLSVIAMIVYALVRDRPVVSAFGDTRRVALSDRRHHRRGLPHRLANPTSYAEQSGVVNWSLQRRLATVGLPG